MRRATPVLPRLRRRLWLPAALLTVALMVWAAASLDSQIQPLLQEYAEYETRADTVRLMNDAIAREMAQSPDLYQDLCDLAYGEDGTLRSVQADTQAVNLARSSLVRAVTDALDAAPEELSKIPVGSLLESALLNNLGPSWTLTIQPQGYVEGELTETVTPAAINRVEYRIDLTLTTAVNMILDGRTHVLQVETTVPLTHLLLEGSIPSYYGQGSG